jgi:EPS-associated MarR family transcriptional regulator
MNTDFDVIGNKPDVNGEAERVRLAVLRLLEHKPSLSQREVSRALGLSLGKTNYLLRALLDKGWIKMRNFRRSDSKLAYAYLLTPSGVSHKLDLTRRFLARKESEFELLQRTIGALRSELASSARWADDYR